MIRSELTAQPPTRDEKCRYIEQCSADHESAVRLQLEVISGFGRGVCP